jgi:hypothetical protein
MAAQGDFQLAGWERAEVAQLLLVERARDYLTEQVLVLLSWTQADWKETLLEENPLNGQAQ